MVTRPFDFRMERSQLNLDTSLRYLFQVLGYAACSEWRVVVESNYLPFSIYYSPSLTGHTYDLLSRSGNSNYPSAS